MQSMKANSIARRIPMVAAILFLLAACQTVGPQPVHGPFTVEQEQTLEQAGFVREGDEYFLGIPNRLLFSFDSSELMAGKATMLNAMATALAGVGIHGARVEGYADAIGASEYNQALSYRRAETVMRMLVAGGMELPAMQVVGLGEAEPVESNETEEGRRENRRVVIVVTPSHAMPL